MPTWDFNDREEKPPSAAVIEARARRLARAQDVDVRTNWFIENVSNVVQMSMLKRMRLAVEYLRSMTVLNVSRPVTKTYYTIKITVMTPKGPKTKNQHRVRISNRSKKGEFPKADTTQLMKTIFTDVKVQGTVIDGFVGSPLDYALDLELKKQRSFLKRTLNEQLPKVQAILTGPV